jgi:hypothetical protein
VREFPQQPAFICGLKHFDRFAVIQLAYSGRQASLAASISNRLSENYNCRWLLGEPGKLQKLDFLLRLGRG